MLCTRCAPSKSSRLAFFDVVEIIFRRYFAERQNLDAIGRVHKKIAEVTNPYGIAHCLPHALDIAALRGIDHIEKVNGVRAVLVILAAEQRRSFIQPGGV